MIEWRVDVVGLLAAAVGALGWLLKLQFDVRHNKTDQDAAMDALQKVMGERNDALQADIDEVHIVAASADNGRKALELDVERGFVRKDEFREFRGHMDERLDKIEALLRDRRQAGP